MNIRIQPINDIIGEILQADRHCNVYLVDKHIINLSKLLMESFKEIKTAHRDRDILTLCDATLHLDKLSSCMSKIQHLLDEERIEKYNVYVQAISWTVKIQIEKWISQV